MLGHTAIDGVHKPELVRARHLEFAHLRDQSAVLQSINYHLTNEGCCCHHRVNEAEVDRACDLVIVDLRQNIIDVDEESDRVLPVWKT